MKSSTLLSSPNPNSLKSKLTHGFLKALLRINTQTHQPKSAKETILKRQRLIKTAALKSMASSVGNTRAWSRALLRRIRNRKRRGFHHQLSMKSKKKRVAVGGSGRVDMLRRIVPGGQAMDVCSLLEETADYMKCLATQVKVMKEIVEIYSTKAKENHMQRLKWVLKKNGGE